MSVIRSLDWVINNNVFALCIFLLKFSFFSFSLFFFFFFYICTVFWSFADGTSDTLFIETITQSIQQTFIKSLLCARYLSRHGVQR